MRRRLLFGLAWLAAVGSLALTTPAAAAGKAKPAAAAKRAAPPPPLTKKKVEDPRARTGDDAAPGGAPAAGGTSAVRGPSRIDFDDRLIQGQTNKSGAVYLYDRKELKTRSMIKSRDNFRDEIVHTVYDL